MKLSNETQDAFDVTLGDLTNRLHGVKAKAGSLFRGSARALEGDEQLLEICSHLGRSLALPRWRWNVTTRVVLRGPVLAADAKRISSAWKRARRAVRRKANGDARRGGQHFRPARRGGASRRNGT